MDKLTWDRDDLRGFIREASDQSDELSSSHLEPSPQVAAFSPFVLKIPDKEPRDTLLHLPTYEDLPEDDIAQFGTPLSQSDRPASRFLQPVVIQQPAPKPALKPKARARTRKALKVSRHGITYSSLPIGITKSIVTSFARPVGKRKARLNKETMSAILEAGDKFFEQLGDDLGAVASHAGRKTIDENDVIAIMQRYGSATFLLYPISGYYSCTRQTKASLSPSDGILLSLKVFVGRDIKRNANASSKARSTAEKVSSGEYRGRHWRRRCMMDSTCFTIDYLHELCERPRMMVSLLPSKT